MRSSSSRNNVSSVVVLYLAYSPNKRWQNNKQIAVLKKLCSRFHSKVSIVYIDNANEEPDYLEKISENEYVISGNNSEWEFSGWQKGIDFVRQKGLACDVFLFANDMYLHDSFLIRNAVDQKAIDCAMRYDAMVGAKANLFVHGSIMGKANFPYVRTHFFFASKILIDALGSLIGIDDKTKEEIFIPQYDTSIPLFRNFAPLSKEIKDIIFLHITKKWGRKKPYTSQNFNFLKNKATAILNSLILSLRVKTLNYPIIDYGKRKFFLSRSPSIDDIYETWLSGRAGKKVLSGKNSWRAKQAFKKVYRRQEKWVVPYHF